MSVSLKLNWIIKEMKKVGAIRLPDHEWSLEMVEDIEFPTSGEGLEPGERVESIFNQIPYDIRRAALPSATDAHMEFIDEDREEEIIARLSNEASQFSSQIPLPLRELLEQNHELALSYITLIQSMVRGYIIRHRENNSTIVNLVNELSGSINVNIPAIVIQRMFRGFLSRGVRYYFKRISFTNNTYGGFQTPRRRAALTATDKRSILFINTGADKYTYQWISNNGSPGRACEVHSFTPTESRAGASISTFSSHWFLIKNISKGYELLIRVPFFHKWRGSTNPLPSALKYVFDVHTGISMPVAILNNLGPLIDSRRFNTRVGNRRPGTRAQYSSRSNNPYPEATQRRVLGAMVNGVPARIVPDRRGRPDIIYYNSENREIINEPRNIIIGDVIVPNNIINDSDDTCTCPRCIARRRREALGNIDTGDGSDDEEDLARLQMGIQLSLQGRPDRLAWTTDAQDYNLPQLFEEPEMITDDAEDFNLDGLFQEPVPLTLREQQDIEYAEAEARDLRALEAQEALSQPVDVEEVREARLARFQ
jgi:hypothetical protein